MQNHSDIATRAGSGFLIPKSTKYVKILSRKQQLPKKVCFAKNT